MNEEEKKEAEAKAEAEKEAEKEVEKAEFEASLEGLSDEEKAQKIAERNQETPEEKAKKILGEDKRILVDKDRFNDRNEKAKIYEAFAPLIEKLKDNPGAVEKLLEIDQKGSLEDRVAKMEGERKVEKRKELNEAVVDALSKWPSFGKDWPEIQEQFEVLVKRGLSSQEAIRRSYLALHPEEAEKEAKRMATDNINYQGTFRSSSSFRPSVLPKEKVDLNDREMKVAQDLLGKNIDGWKVPINSPEDYAKLLKKHEAHLKASGFYDLP